MNRLNIIANLPADCDEREVFVVDPMLATGGSSVAAIQMLKDKGVKHIRFMCIIAAPEGVRTYAERASGCRCLYRCTG